MNTTSPIPGRNALCILLLIALFSPAPRCPAQDQAPVAVSAGDDSAPPSTIQKDRKKLAGLLWISVILLVLLFAVLAIGRFSLRYRQFLIRGRRPEPTPSDDLWAQHRDPRETQTLVDPDFDRKG